MVVEMGRWRSRVTTDRARDRGEAGNAASLESDSLVLRPAVCSLELTRAKVVANISATAFKLSYYYYHYYYYYYYYYYHYYYYYYCYHCWYYSINSSCDSNKMTLASAGAASSGDLPPGLAATGIIGTSAPNFVFLKTLLKPLITFSKSFAGF